MSQQFRLKRNSHLSNLLSILKSFQSSDILVDVTLSCEGRNIKAHKVILSASSPYFESLFTENPCQHPIVIINGMAFDIVQAIMDFIYKGDVDIAQDRLPAFLKAAESLQIKGLEAGSSENNIISAASQPQPVDTPGKRRHRGRKRSLSSGTKSDEETVVKEEVAVKSESLTPDVQDLSGDEPFPVNSHPYPVFPPQTTTHGIVTEPDSDEGYDIEPSKFMTQTLTTSSESPSNHPADASSSMSSEPHRKEKKMRGDTESSYLQGSSESQPGERKNSSLEAAGDSARLWHFPSYVTSSGSTKKNPCRQCVVCGSKRNENGKRVRKETRFECELCNVGLCASPCFKVYHTAAFLDTKQGDLNEVNLNPDLIYDVNQLIF